ncbi:Stress-induced morphogen [Halalkaliarchaeum sp. AArc-CO]|uniref:BolA family protein n=1 Tax=unclassified Halalkaliarchaeum TaxID=2678344 RepID=UPI00217F0F47|nr:MULTISPECIES: BolA family protein [unclassified Halalkaliarchaeum]MDR5673240.1 BolA family protein [Halalkaliarchaeum sp. AArc-GB]UWG51801.1 Stress-induced morphogen [Halalkaliarchaeum sp. AArc-CO]
MDVEAIEARIEEAIADAEATVSRPRTYDENHEDEHFAAVVVSPAFDGLSLVEQHQLVYDALDDWMTEEIHALEIKTYTPAEYEEFGGGA